jgi:MAP/microtubule affinity-regulating kinase
MLLAIKIYDKFKLSEPSRKKSVIREVQILKKLQHSSLPALYDVIDSPSQLYLVMEYVMG